MGKQNIRFMSDVGLKYIFARFYIFFFFVDTKNKYVFELLIAGRVFLYFSIPVICKEVP